ncbi:hypothetical protein GCM10009415_09370 [Chitinophaga japonensis]
MLPLKQGLTALVNQYRNILTNAQGIEIYEINNNIALTAVRLRASYNLRTPDALQLSTALERDADFFLTNEI